VQAISFPESPFPLTSGRKTRALGATILKQPNSAHPVSLHSLHLWRTPEMVASRALSRFPTADQGERRLWERDCSAIWPRIRQQCYHSNMNSGIEFRVTMIKSLNQSLWLHITIYSTPVLPPSFDLGFEFALRRPCHSRSSCRYH